MKGDEERCLEAGMNGYLSKPVTSDKLADMITRVVPPLAEDPAPAAPPRLAVEQALANVDGDVELLAELGRLFREDWPARLAELHAARNQRDAERLERAAHAVKGALTVLGACRPAGLAAEVEARAREARFDEAAPLLDRLETEVAEETALS
jgi:HPt (histidine-containing phosphotransfer) domain-containing protein